MPKKPRKADLIEKASIRLKKTPDFTANQSKFYLNLIDDLSSENERLKADLDQSQGKLTYEDVRAKLMGPYANRVFCFLVGYCLFVGVILLLHGFKICSFELPELVLSVIAGSTAAAAIGLVGFVVSGLFKQPLP